ncbi:MATE efflux family protein isoform 1 [Dorcoceras hygrometricum]|uniref:Protein DETOXIFICATION n=1 Tax=Dorcoceras hygrometricum TaxID=472368 RepID=A0A2Z7DAU8_9LAMI|nr:MATE efflux family protein isoform 1 [Dorcoceras hygrometricum]
MENSTQCLTLPTMNHTCESHTAEGPHLITSKEEQCEDDGWNRESTMFYKTRRLKQIAEKLASIASIVGPIFVTGLLMYSKSFISMLFLGYLGDTELSGGSLSISFANISGYSVLKGLAMGMEPICYQAYGAKRWGILSQTYRKTLFLLLVAAIPISLLWLNMEPILLWLGQDESIAAVAKIYIKYSTPDLIAQAHFHPLRTFLRTQNINRPLTVSIICAMLLHCPINYFLAVHLNMGVKGVALASAWNTLNVNLGLLSYLLLSKNSLKPWDRDTANTFLEGWQTLLALAGPSVLSVCLEWWCYEILLLLCSLLSNPQASVAAMGILIQTTGFLYIFPSSLSTGLSIQVGHELGADQPRQAQRTTITGLTLAILWGILAIVFTIAVKDVWGKLFTSEPQILYLVSITLPILGFCELGNSPQTTACGILVGCARPKMACNINFVSFYVIGLPVAVLLAFRFNMGFVGLWFGLAAAEVSCTCMMVCTLFYTNWEQQASKAKVLTQEKEDNKNDLEASLLS